MSAIECLNLGKVYRQFGRRQVALDQLNLVIEPQQVFGFLGPNGAGKTTTIRLLLDLIRPTAGDAKLYGQSVRNNPAALRKVGALVEGSSFYPYLSGWDNLKILAWTMGDFNEKRTRQLIERLGLSGREHDAVRKYSLGMKQRLGIVAALLHDPDLLILDEPTNGLDPAGIHELRGFIRQLVEEEGKTVFLSSHLLNEMQLVCDRVAILNRGQLVVEGRVDALLSQALSEGLTLEVGDVEGSLSALQAEWPATPIPNTQNIRIDATREAVPSVIRQLVDAQIDIYDVTFTKPTLERVFLSLTQTSKPAQRGA